jgi:hypothetical protein
MARSDWQIQVAFYLSLLTAGFSVYQWQHTQEESTIAASIDFARKYLNDNELAQARKIATSLYHLRKDPGTLSPTESDGWNKLTTNAMYLAQLLDQKKVDPGYITDLMFCDCWLVIQVTRLRLRPGVQNRYTSPLGFLADERDTMCRHMYGG